MNLGKTILDLRKAKNMTQEDLASQLGVTPTAVSKWENNNTLPDILMLCALADCFEVTADELLGREKEKRYACVASASRDLGDKIVELAMQHGIETLFRFKDFSDAVEAANADSRVRYLLVSCEDARFSMENTDTRDDLKTIVSLGNSHQDILNGFKMMLRE